MWGSWDWGRGVGGISEQVSAMLGEKSKRLDLGSTFPTV